MTVNRRQFLTGFALLSTYTFLQARPMAAAPMRLLDAQSRILLDIAPNFSAADAFRPGHVIGARKLALTTFNFERLFGSANEFSYAPAAIASWSLRFHAGDEWLRDELQRTNFGTPLMLAHVHALMSLQGNLCRVDGGSNFAYVRSQRDGRIWAIHWRTDDARDWVVGAVEVPHPHLDWPPGSRLFGRGPDPSTVPDAASPDVAVRLQTTSQPLPDNTSR